MKGKLIEIIVCTLIIAIATLAVVKVAVSTAKKANEICIQASYALPAETR